MGQTHLHTDTESHQHAQMRCEEKSNTNSVGCVLCGSCGESVTYLFPLKMISPFPSPFLFFVMWVRDEGAEERRLKQFFLFFTVPVEVREVCWEGRVFTECCRCCIIYGPVCSHYLCVHPSLQPTTTQNTPPFVSVCMKEVDQDKCMCLLCE